MLGLTAATGARAALSGDFDPKVLAPSTEFATPHIAWLKPAQGAPLRVLFIMSQHAMREVVEIAQRTDLDYQVYAIPARPTPEGFSTPPLKKDDYRRDLQEKLDAPNQLIVVGVENWNWLSLWERYRILKKVKDGTPMIAVAASADEYLKRATAKDTAQPLLDFLVPFKGLPAYRDAADSATFLKNAVAAFRFGNGTITLLKGFRVWPPQAFTPPWPGGLELNLVEYDYYLGFVIHLMQAAAGQLPPVQVRGESLQPRDRDALTPLQFTLAATGPRKVLCRFVLRNRDNQVLASEERRLDLAGGNAPVQFAFPKVPAGDCFADLWVLEDGKIIDFGSAFVPVSSASAISALTVAASFGKSEPVSGTASLTLKPGDQGLMLHVRQRDLYGRVTAEVTVPVPTADAATEDVAFQLPATVPLSIVQYVEAELCRAAEVLARKRAAYSVSDLRPPDDSRYVIWGVGQCAANTYLGYHAYRACREAGYDTQYTGFTTLVPLADMWHLPYATRIHPDEEFGKTAKGPDVHIRKPCLSDAADRAAEAKKLSDIAARLKPFSVSEFSMGDECHLQWATQNELCFSPACVAVFHESLKREYGNLDAVNQEYGTKYASFDEVQPVTLADAMKTPTLGPLWVDYRRHMESVWADFQGVCRDSIQSVIPDARVGYEGTDYDNIGSFEGFEFDKIMRIMRLNNTYDGVFSPYAIVDLSQPGTLVSTGWFGSYEEYKRYHDWPSQTYNRYIPWRHLFRGSNSFWVWYACVADNGVGHGSVMAPDFSFFECFQTNLPEMRDIKHGPGKLIMHATRENDATAILYSPSSIHAATLCGMSGVQQDVLRSLIPLMEDTRRQFRIVSYRQVAEGILEKGKYRFLFLPFAQALSKQEAENIRAFVKNGGTVIADLRPGVCDEHGKAWSGNGALDDVFGVTQEPGPKAVKDGTVTFAGAPFPDTFPKTYTDATLKLASGQAVAKAGEAPALVTNTFGSGKAMLWNFSLHAYQRNAGVLAIEVEKLTEQAPQVKALFEVLAGQAGLASELTVSPAVEGLRAYRHHAGSLRYLGLLQHPCRAQAAALAKAGADAATAGKSEPPAPVPTTIGLDGTFHVYDIRNGRYVGKTDRIKAVIRPGDADFYSLLPYRVKGLDVDVPGKAAPGETLHYRVDVKTDGATPELHIVRVTFVDPDGREADHYSWNLAAPAGHVQGTIPLALNGKPGTWKLVARDVATGTTETKNVKLREAQ
ncbi:MAG: hypothetical protein A3K19_02035 [Lentisphaerae bacterium RIFOXYB12_FULL_65_16]|nr:MAG: hypothetical protein A3K18_25255 [Lentisphaerae bacterium RIFOXYA12_64_32]OGV92579.1 MAG: hypothetical protein A3K19_02035 [Lentisphaerae bacterium RIFOXYB12_FULL_65_16]